MKQLFKVILVYISWWLILFGSSVIAKLLFNAEYYMLAFYGLVLVVTYISYLAIPIYSRNINSQRYLNEIGFQMTQPAMVLSFVLLAGFILSIYQTQQLLPSITLTGLAGLNWLVFTQPPVVEELLFRGVIPRQLSSHSIFMNAVISTVLFASLHIQSSLQGVVFSAVVGLILFVLRFQVNSIFPGMVIHYMLNSGVTLSLIYLLVIGIVWEVYYFVRLHKNKVKEKSVA
ncbi:CPBP family intramembrane metalloprotease [Vagococcus coleopterorum]|uniref:CPBP family intramembrane metalloprotease n=1 Tax=Vagococcus coleopterorum TaxID=2714946 RepID=A0A6G8ANG6_9ENTE|nr:CPBP family intramembrane glutamic endopeptidase [Vagococcus coleopterorum]QIL46537.1 CPBP family intramembrane metalloprotease [Vagococcus coleopterorum]